MRAYCDGNEDQIVSAINDVKGKAYIVRIGLGVRIIRDWLDVAISQLVVYIALFGLLKYIKNNGEASTIAGISYAK